MRTYYILSVKLYRLLTEKFEKRRKKSEVASRAKAVRCVDTSI